MTAGADIAAEVAAAIAEAGAATGDGELTATLIRPGTVDESTSPPTIGQPTRTPCRVLLQGYTDRDRQNDAIRVGDVKIMVAVNGISAPTTNDRIAVSGREYDIINVEAVQPGGVALYWTVQARGGNPV